MIIETLFLRPSSTSHIRHQLDEMVVFTILI